MEGVTLSDIAALNHNDEWGGSYMWIIVLFALIFGWGGNGFGNNGFANAIGYENLATSNEVQRGFDNQNSLANQREILAAVNQNFHDTAQYVGDKYSELQRDIAALQVGQANALANQNECCCNMRMEIQAAAAQQRYESAMQNAATNQLIIEKVQGVQDMITGNRMADMQNQINRLELSQAMQGVVRYPEGFVYNAGSNPFCGCNSYGCNNI